MKGALLMLGLLALPAGSQPYGARPPPLALGTIEGRVVSAATSAPIAGADLRLDSLGIGTRSDQDGRFRLANVPAGHWRLHVEAAGFGMREVVVNVASEGTTRLDIGLPPPDGDAPNAGDDGPFGEDADDREPDEPVLLPPLRVLSRADAGRLRSHAPSGRLVDSARFDLVPTVVERDLFRVLQTLPSVTPTSDYSSALLVRGGAPDQTRIHLDGIPLHNPFHVGGFVSTFTPEAVGPAVLRPGGLAASVPSSLSGLLELETRTPGRDSLLVRGGVGLLSSSVVVDGPMNGGRGGFLVSGRRTYIDLATRGMDAVGLIEEHLPYAFTDLLTRLEHDVGSRTRVQVTGHLNREGMEDFDETVDASWGSDALGLRLHGLAGPRTEWELTGGTSGFGADYLRSDEPFSLMGPPVADSSLAEGSVRSWILDGTVRHPTGNHLLHAGARWERHDAGYSLRPDGSDDDHIPRLDLSGAWGSAGLFLRDRWSADSWTFDLGVRAERPRARGWHVLPRIRIERDVGGGWSLALAGGTYVQDWWGLRNEESALADLVAYEVLVPVPADRPLARGRDIVLEARGDLGAVALRADLFRKTLRNVPSPFPSVDPLDAPLIFAPDSVVLGRSSIRGVELAAEGRLGSTALALSYRYQNERRTVDGFRFRPRTERPHRLTLTGNRPWGGREVAFALTWMSGIPFTPVEAVLPGISGVASDGRPAHTLADRLAFGEPNGERVRSYLRLDVGIRGALDVELFGQRGALEPYVSVLNVLNRHNALAVDHEFDRLAQVVRKVGPQFPVLPSFGVRFRF